MSVTHTASNDVSPRNLGPATTTMRTILAEDPVRSGRTVSELPGGPLALFANPFLDGAEECFLYDANGHLTYLHRVPDGEGWAQQEFRFQPEPGAAVVTAVHPDGSVWLFVSGNDELGSLSMFRLDGVGQWAPVQGPGLPDGWVHLSVQYMQDRPATPVVIGVNAARDYVRVLRPVFTSSGEEPAWRSELSVALETPLPEAFLCGIDRLDPLIVRTYSLAGSTLTRRTWWQRWDPDVVVATDAVTLGGPWSSRQGLGCVYGTQAGAGVYPVLYCPYSEREPGHGTLFPLKIETPLTDLSVWQDHRDMAHIYGLADGTLQVLHQERWVASSSGASEPVFVGYQLGKQYVAMPFPLVGGVAGYVLDPAPDTYPSQLTRHPDGPSAHSHQIQSQDVTTSWWLSEPVRIPQSGQIHIARRYVCDVTLRDGFGAPLPRCPVLLAAESAVDVEVDGRVLRLGPEQMAAAVTDEAGKVTLRVDAGGLTVPLVHVRAKGLADGAAIDPGASVQGFLAGTSALAAHPQGLSADLLKDARVSDGWLVPGWHPPPTAGTPTSLPSADDVVRMCADAFAAAHGGPLPARHVEGEPEPVVPAGFVLQTWDPDQPAYRMLLSGDDDLAEWHATGSVVRLGDWGDPFAYLSDLWQGIRDGVLDVLGVAVVAGQGALVRLKDFEGSQVEFAVDLLSEAEASKVVEAIFQCMDAGVDRLVEWLTWTIDFTQVWNTAQAMTAGLRQLPDAITSTADHFLKDLAPTWFELQQGKVADAFGTVRTQLAGRSVGSCQGLGSEVVEAPLVLHQPDVLVGPQLSWVQDLLVRETGSVAVAAAPDLTALTDAWQEVWSIFTDSEAGLRFAEAVGTLRSAIGELWDADDAQTVASTTMTALLDVAEAAVSALLALADQIIQAFGAFVTTAAAALDTILDTEVLQGTWFATVFEWFQRQAGVPDADVQPPTIGGMGALFFAFPVTAMYQMVRGQPPFPDGTFPVLPPPPWSSPSGPSQERPSAGPQDLRDWSLALQVICGLSQVAYTGIDYYVDTHEPTQPMNLGIAAFELLGFTLAGHPVFWDTPFDSAAVDDIAWAQWGLWTLLYMADLICSGPGPDHCLVTNYGGKAGSGILFAAGLAQVALAGAAYGVSDQEDLDWDWLWAGISGAISTLTAPVRLLQNVPTKPARVTLSLKALVDLFVDPFSGFSYTKLAVGAITSPVHVDTPTLPDGTVGVPYEATLKASGGYAPYGNWQPVPPEGLPPGLQLDADTGTLYGTPAAKAAGDWSFQVSCSDYYSPPSTGTSVAFKITIATPPGAGQAVP